MALINCPECGKEISDKATNCPHCGFPVQKEKVARQTSEKRDNIKSLFQKNSRKILVTLIALFCLIIAYIVINSIIYPNFKFDSFKNYEKMYSRLGEKTGGGKSEPPYWDNKIKFYGIVVDHMEVQGSGEICELYFSKDKANQIEEIVQKELRFLGKGHFTSDDEELRIIWRGTEETDAYNEKYNGYYRLYINASGHW